MQKGGNSRNIVFMNNLRVKIKRKVILIHKIDKSDGLTNGQLGTIIDVFRTVDGSIAKFIMEFKKENVGKQSRAINQQFTAKYPKGTVIDKVSSKYSLSKKASTDSSTATVYL